MNRWLRLCALAYPRVDRAEVLSLAEELVDDGAPVHREAAGLLRAGLEARLGLTGAPWREALDRLGLPFAGLLLAAVLMGIAQSDQGRFEWIGWSWAAGLVGAILAVLGLGTGRRALALPGAGLVAALCLLDGTRDLYGGGSRWVALWVDVLPALLPAALVLMAASAAPQRRSFRALAWSLAGAVTLTVAGLALERHTALGTMVLAATLGLVVAAALASVRRHAAPPDRLAAVIALGAVAPASIWSLMGAAPVRPPDELAPLLLAGFAVATATALLKLARSVTSPRRGLSR